MHRRNIAAAGPPSPRWRPTSEISSNTAVVASTRSAAYIADRRTAARLRRAGVSMTM
jgi:hypothetical protein